MPGEGFDVGDDDGAGFLPGSAADSPAVADTQAGGRALERPEDQFAAAHDIESHPEKLHPFIDESGGLGHACDGIRFIPEQSGDILIQTQILEGPQGQMAVAVGVLVEIFLMPLLRLVEGAQRLEFNLQRLPDAGLDGRVNLLKHRQIGRIRIIDTGAVAGACVVPLLIEAEGVDDVEIQFREQSKGDFLRTVTHPDRLRKAGGIGVNLLVRGTAGEIRIPLRISADGRNHAVDPGEEVLCTPEASPCKIDLFHTSTQWIFTPLRSIPRNQVIWRFANWWMAMESFSKSSCSESSPRRNKVTYLYSRP